MSVFERGAQVCRRPLSAMPLLLACGLGCQVSNRPSFVGNLSLVLVGQAGGQVASQAPNPCELDVDFGAVRISQQANATIEIANKSSMAITLLPFSPDLDPEFSLSFSEPQPQSIPAGGAARLAVSFEVYRSGAALSTFSIPTSAPLQACGSSSSSSVTLKLTGLGVDLNLVVSPEGLDFGNTLQDTTASRTATLSNRSTSPLTGITAVIGGLNAGNFALGNVPSWLDAGASVPVEVTFTPLTLENRSVASVTFNSSDDVGASLILVGEPVDSALVVQPSTLDFGYIIAPATAVACTTLTDQANVAITISGLTDFVSMDGAFALSPTDGATPPNPASLPVMLTSGASAKVCFSFAPPGAEQYFGQATLLTDDPGRDSPVISLSGWGEGPQISCVPSSLAFGQVLDHTVATLPVTCTNVGTTSPANLTISPLIAGAAVFSTRFDETINPYPAAGLVPGQSAQIDVDYQPVAGSLDRGTLVLKTNGGQGTAVPIPLAGQGLDLTPCQFVIAPAAVDFGNVPLGDSSVPLSFAIENLGAQACVVHELGIRNDQPGNFHLISTSIQPDPQFNSITIPASSPGASSSLVVQLGFMPALQGMFSAEVGFSISNPAAPNQVVQLSGSSESTCLVLAPPSLNFGDVGVNGAGTLCTSAGRSISVFNDCATQASLVGLKFQSGAGDLVPQFSTPSGAALPLLIDPGSTAVLDLLFDPTTLGEHTAQLLASDGTVEATLSLTGAAVPTGTETDSFVVGPAKADVLFILDVDDDAPEQALIVSQAPTFFAAASDIDYRIAVTTDNDYAAEATAEFGRLLPCSTCSLGGPAPTIISPSSVPVGGMQADPTKAFADFLSSVPNNAYPTGGAIDEHFFAALYNVLQHAPQTGVDFFRPGVYFAAITDNGDNEADASILASGNHDPAWYASYFEAYFGNPMLFTWNYVNPTQTIITGTGFSNILQLPPSIQEMISATGGFAVNTSDSHWATALNAVWSSAIEAGSYYPLVGSPSEGQSGITLTRNGKAVPQLAGPGLPNWIYQASLNAIVFSSRDAVMAGDQLGITYPVACQ